MAITRSLKHRRQRPSDNAVKLNITSMIDMFTLMVVFLLQNYSSQGQMVTPAKNLTLPKSTVEKKAQEATTVKVAKNSISVDNTFIVDQKTLDAVIAEKKFLIEPLFDVLSKQAETERKTKEKFGGTFSGAISIQGDEEIPFEILTRVMYTCGQAGFANMNLVVYRK